jgi:hypothetical protein
VLELALKRPELIDIISEIFNPTVCPAPYFCDMYKFLVDAFKFKKDPQILFVLLNKVCRIRSTQCWLLFYLFFSQFDVSNWLRNFKPKLAEISNVIDCILDGLVTWTGADDSSLQEVESIPNFRKTANLNSVSSLFAAMPKPFGQRI